MSETATREQLTELIVGGAPQKIKRYLLAPLGANHQDDYQFVGALAQWLAVIPHANVFDELPDYIEERFVGTPMHPSFGKGYIRTTTGFALCWTKPEIKVGEYYRHIKPFTKNIYEETFKRELKLQTSLAVPVNVFRENYISEETYQQVFKSLAGPLKPAINKALIDFYNLNWAALGAEKLFKDGKPIVFHEATLDLMKFSAYNSEPLEKYQGKENIYGQPAYLGPGGEKGLYDAYKAIIEEAKGFKNIRYYDVEVESSWVTKTDNHNQIKTKKWDKNKIKDQKTLCQTLYAVQKDGHWDTPFLSRQQAVYAALKQVQAKVKEITDQGGASHIWWSEYDPDLPISWDGNTGHSNQPKKENAELHKTWCPKDRCRILVSHWDYPDFVSGGTSGIGGPTITLEQAAQGVKYYSTYTLLPGQIVIGDIDLFRYITVLNDQMEIKHPREVEVQYYFNYWVNFARFKMLAAIMLMPVDNYTASADFYERASKFFQNS